MLFRCSDRPDAMSDAVWFIGLCRLKCHQRHIPDVTRPRFAAPLMSASRVRCLGTADEFWISVRRECDFSCFGLLKGDTNRLNLKQAKVPGFQTHALGFSY